MKKSLRQNVFSYAYLAGQNVLLKVRNTSAINMGPIRYDTVLSGLGIFFCANEFEPFPQVSVVIWVELTQEEQHGQVVEEVELILVQLFWLLLVTLVLILFPWFKMKVKMDQLMLDQEH